jgi:hypothetical protein
MPSISPGALVTLLAAAKPSSKISTKIQKNQLSKLIPVVTARETRFQWVNVRVYGQIKLYCPVFRTIASPQVVPQKLSNSQIGNLSSMI